MKKKVLVLLCSIVMIFGLFGCSGGGGEESSDAVAFVVATEETDNSIVGMAMTDFETYVEEESGGAIDVQVHHNGTLGSEREMIEGLTMGSIHLAMGTASAFQGNDEKFGFLDTPFLFSDYDAIHAALDGEIGKLYNEWFNEIGYICHGWGVMAPRGMSNSVRPIHTPADLKGLKFRVIEADAAVRQFELMGANPVTMAYDEVYTGLQQGTIDGQDNPPIYTVDSGFYEEQPYYTRTNHQFSAGPYLSSVEYFNSLSDEHKAILKEGIAIMIERINEEFIASDADYVQIMEDAGVEVVELTDEERQAFIEKVQPMIDDMEEIVGKEMIEMALSY